MGWRPLRGKGHAQLGLESMVVVRWSEDVHIAAMSAAKDRLLQTGIAAAAEATLLLHKT